MYKAGRAYAARVSGSRPSPAAATATSGEGLLTVRELLAVPALGLHLLAAPDRSDSMVR